MSDTDDAGVLDAAVLEQLQSVIVDVVQEVYAEEEEAAGERIRRACENSWLEEALTWLPYVGDLLDSSCIAPDPPSLAAVDRRADIAVQKIEARLGGPLDEETRENVRTDIRSIWGY